MGIWVCSRWHGCTKVWVANSTAFEQRLLEDAASAASKYKCSSHKPPSKVSHPRQRPECYISDRTPHQIKEPMMALGSKRAKYLLASATTACLRRQWLMHRAAETTSRSLATSGATTDDRTGMPTEWSSVISQVSRINRSACSTSWTKARVFWFN